MLEKEGGRSMGRTVSYGTYYHLPYLKGFLTISVKNETITYTYSGIKLHTRYCTLNKSPLTSPIRRVQLTVLSLQE